MKKREIKQIVEKQIMEYLPSDCKKPKRIKGDLKIKHLYKNNINMFHLRNELNKIFNIDIGSKITKFTFHQLCNFINKNISKKKSIMSLIDSDLKQNETITQENNPEENLVEENSVEEDNLRNESFKLLDLSRGLIDYVREKNRKTKISYKIVVTEEGVEIFERNLGVYPAGDKVDEKELQEDFEKIITNGR